MFKVGGVSSPQFQFLTSFVCGQQNAIDTGILFCAIQQATQRKQLRIIIINSIGYLIVEIFSIPISIGKMFYLLCGIYDHSFFLKTLIKRHINMYISLILTNIDF